MAGNTEILTTALLGSVIEPPVGSTGSIGAGARGSWFHCGTACVLEHNGNQDPRRADGATLSPRAALHFKSLPLASRGFWAFFFVCFNPTGDGACVCAAFYRSVYLDGGQPCQFGTRTRDSACSTSKDLGVSRPLPGSVTELVCVLRERI